MTPSQQLRCKALELALQSRHSSDTFEALLSKAKKVEDFILGERPTQPPASLPDFGAAIPDGKKSSRKKD